MKVDSRYFRSPRYRTLYLLLPIMNGALFMAAIIAAYGIFDVAETSGEFTGDFWIDSTASTVRMLSLVAQGVVGGVFLAIVDLAILGRIYRANLIAALFDSWRRPRKDRQHGLLILGPIMLTALGDLAVLLAITYLFAWQIPSTGPGFLFVGIAYIFWVLPMLAQAEKEKTYGASGEAERANDAPDEAGA